MYRFLRELERRGLADAYAQAHGRLRWRLRERPSLPGAHASHELGHMVTHVRDLLRALEGAGFAAASPHDAAAHFDGARMLAALHELALQLGYRLFLPTSQRHGLLSS